VKTSSGSGQSNKAKGDLLCILYRQPRLGQVKTRLCQDLAYLGAEDARNMTLELYQAFLEDLRRGLVGTWPGDIQPWVADLLPGEGAWWPGSREQEAGDLGQRMFRALEVGLDQGYERVLLIGSDIPWVRGQDLQDLFAHLEQNPLVLAPSADGGYYAIGVNARISQVAPRWEHFMTLPQWGHERVLVETLERARTLGLEAALGPVNQDFDRLQELDDWFLGPGGPGLCPRTFQVWKKTRRTLWKPS